MNWFRKNRQPKPSHVDSVDEEYYDGVRITSSAMEMIRAHLARLSDMIYDGAEVIVKKDGSKRITTNTIKQVLNDMSEWCDENPV